ncbi:HYR domain-containing protein [Streptomyces sp. JH002]|uniref:HYR domain-containing protein n=1 Tax=Streptomyces sp. JH002 TaxID=2763259 RepID=UPI003D806E87
MRGLALGQWAAGRPGGGDGRWRVALSTVLILLAASISGSAAGGAAYAAAVDPGPGTAPGGVTREADPGETIEADKEIRTPVVPPRPDVVLLVDGTGSMQPTIDRLRETLTVVTDRVRQEQPDSRFAVISFGDDNDETDGSRTFEVHTPLTYDLTAVQDGVDDIEADRGGWSGGPAEDWINALWQIGTGAGGATEFRDGASPIVVLIGDASSHDPSMGHHLSDVITLLRNIGARTVAVDIDTPDGDGLNGDGTHPDWGTDPPHPPGQADALVAATDGQLIEGIDANRVSEAIVQGLTNLSTTVTHQSLVCDPALTVVLTPEARTVTSGASAAFAETITVAGGAPQGATLTCVVQFLLNGRAPNGIPPELLDPDAPPPAAPEDDEETDPDYRQTITITVNDLGAPVVTIDDRTVRATEEDGVRIEYTATAEDAVDGALPVECEPPSGAVFPVGTTEVVCTATDSAGNTGTGTATFTVLPVLPDPPAPPPPPSADVAVTAAVDPVPGSTGLPVTTEFTLTNAGPDTAEGLVLATAWPRRPDPADRTVEIQSACTVAAPCTVAPGERMTVTQTATYGLPLSGELRATVSGTTADPAGADNATTARIDIVQPELTVTPEVGTPGSVAIVRGENFPPGTDVALSWEPGITAAQAPVRAAADGTFETQVLVLRKDQLGARVLRAETAEFEPFEEDFLVVQRTLRPPDFIGRS